MLLGGLLAAQASAGGVNVWDEEIYTDGVTLTDWTGAPLDIDGDGNSDLAVAPNRNGLADSSRYYLGNGDGTFSAPVLLTEGKSSVIGAADLNEDTFVDLLQAARDSEDILYLNDGAGGVDGGTDLSAETNRSLSVAFGDLDEDGDLDIVIGTGRFGGSDLNPAQRNRFYLNDWVPNGTVTFTGSDISADEDVARSIALTDVDGDGHLDVIAASDETTLLLGSRVYLNEFPGGGTVSFAAGLDFGPADDLTTKVLVGDLDADGNPDLVTLNFGAQNRFFLNKSTPGTVVLDPPISVSNDTDSTNGGVLADFDSDGDLDLAVANFLSGGAGQSSRNRLYLNQFIETSTVSFSAGIDISDDEHQSHQLAAADLNEDGHIDIVVGNEDDIPGVPGFDRRYLNNGTADPFTNVSPVIDAPVDVLATAEDTTLPVVLEDLTVTDPDNVFPADFTLTVQAGANYTVSDNTITPAAGFSGDLIVPVIVNDGTDDSEPFDLTVNVAAVNDPPSFTSTAVTAASEGAVYTYDVTTSDPDGSDTLIISAATALPAWLELNDNGDGTAVLTGTPAAADVGDHQVSLQVSDGTETAVQDFTITVEADTTVPPPPPPPPPSPSGGGGGGGSFGLMFLLALCTAGALGRSRGIFRRGV